MEIRILQSLIDRTSNQIHEYEWALFMHKEAILDATSDFEAQHSVDCVRHYKTQLKKLREIQKALKKEIARSLYKAKVSRMIENGWKQSFSIDK